MPTNLEELLPDFEDMNTVATASSEARLQAHLVKDELDAFIAECVRRAYQDQQYWLNGKPPVQTYIERTVAITGNTAEDAQHIKNLRDRYSELQKVVDESRALLQNMRDRVAAFQTISSNKRAGVL
jgi:hypothetical protein